MYLKRGECFTDQCVYESDRFGGRNVILSGLEFAMIFAISSKLFKEN